uniref:Uncharacterized protein n=1 Tax=Triticum urartu TaxID=4572 RepID=A0A8R7PDC9_TRIUA
ASGKPIVPQSPQPPARTLPPPSSQPPPPRTLAAPSCILPSLVRPKLLLLLRPHMLHPEHAGGEAHREAPEQLSQSPSVQEEPRGQRSQQRWRVQELGLDGPPAVREGHVRAEGQ